MEREESMFSESKAVNYLCESFFSRKRSSVRWNKARNSLIIFIVLFHFLCVRRKLDNFEEHSRMDEATSEDLAFPSPSGRGTAPL